MRTLHHLFSACSEGPQEGHVVTKKSQHQEMLIFFFFFNLWQAKKVDFRELGTRKVCYLYATFFFTCSNGSYLDNTFYYL